MMRVVDLARAEGDVTRVAVDEIGGADQAFFDRRRRGDDLERRAGLVGVLDRPVAASDQVGAAELVRVEGRPVRKREDFAGLRLHDDRRAARGLVLLDPGRSSRSAMNCRYLSIVSSRLAPAVGRAPRASTSPSAGHRAAGGSFPPCRGSGCRTSIRDRRGRDCRHRHSQAGAQPVRCSGSSAGSPCRRAHRGDSAP